MSKKHGITQTTLTCNLSVYTEFVRTTPVNIKYARYRKLSRFSSWNTKKMKFRYISSFQSHNSWGIVSVTLQDLITIQISAKLEIVQFNYMYTLNINFNDYRKILSLFLMSNYNRIYLSMIRLWTTKTFFFSCFSIAFSDSNVLCPYT